MMENDALSPLNYLNLIPNNNPNGAAVGAALIEGPKKGPLAQGSWETPTPTLRDA